MRCSGIYWTKFWTIVCTKFEMKSKINFRKFNGLRAKSTDMRLWNGLGVTSSALALIKKYSCRGKCGKFPVGLPIFGEIKIAAPHPCAVLATQEDSPSAQPTIFICSRAFRWINNERSCHAVVDTVSSCSTLALLKSIRSCDTRSCVGPHTMSAGRWGVQACICYDMNVHRWERVHRSARSHRFTQRDWFDDLTGVVSGAPTPPHRIE